MTPKFRLGTTVATPAAMDAFSKTTDLFTEFTTRHMCGDWGECCEEDTKTNNNAIANEGDIDKQQRVMSVYKLEDDTVIWVITEYDRSCTTILLPSDY
jgi:hypothetical protein